MDKIIKRIGNLLSVKSMVTLILTVIFSVMALHAGAHGASRMGAGKCGVAVDGGLREPRRYKG